MSRTKKILVTAVGGDLGQAIVKALRLSHSRYEVFGCDKEESPVGELLVERFFTVPSAHDHRYIGELKRLADDLQLDAIIPGSEPEIRALIASCPDLQFSAVAGRATQIICQTPEIFGLCGDKLKTFEALKGKVTLALFADGKNETAVKKLVSESKFPLIVKERSASGSAKISLVSNQDKLRSAVTEFEKPVVQEYIDDQQGEFSIGCYANGSEFRVIIFNRKLGSNGASWWAESVEHSGIRDYCISVMKALKTQGSINIQVRVNDKGIFLLEINPRFSSLVAARAAAGFQDVEWSLAASFGESLTPFSHQLIKRIRYKRYLAEVVDVGNGFESIGQWSLKR